MRDFTGVSGASGGSADLDTRWTPEVANAIVQEIANVVTNPLGGNTPLDPGDNGQLLASLQTMIAAALATTSSRKRGSYIGTLVVTATVYVPFDVPFPDGTNYALALTAYNGTGSAARDNWMTWFAKSEAGFYAQVAGTVTGGDNTIDGFDWIAEAI
jgi:hypothetical protein